MDHKKLKEIMRARGFTLDMLSHASQIPLSTLAKIESGITKNPGCQAIEAISNALRCSMDELFDRETSVPYELEEYYYRYNKLPKHRQDYIKFLINVEYDRMIYLKNKDKTVITCYEFLNWRGELAECSGKKLYMIETDYNALTVQTTFCVYMNTDKFMPFFFPDSILCFQYIDDYFPKHGEIWMFLKDGYLMARRVYKNKNLILLKALYDEEEDIDITNNYKFKRIGRYIGTLNQKDIQLQKP
ncbi:XRE family transcriptional regulator [Diplocloster modestus]|uniref:LexA family transcriptional regulator n=1 Tax=Diplocloster modestus TaxID=2850322 RepID=A0ABS6K919_9FIRM|nr:XRE family transcriptional regulator [Diplocloster modestus]MBU9727002.1 LexA family transcriptional regulator [Diplocloster modestus]